MTSCTPALADRPPAALRFGLWTAQGALAATFVGGGLWKLTTPIDQLADSFPWVAEVSPALVHSTSVLDVLGGLGILLPSVTRIRPRMAVVAALGCAALQLGAIAFHAARGEAADTPFNVVMLAGALFVAWGRSSAVPVPSRAS